MKPENATYPPLDTLKPAADGVWVVDSGPLHVLGMPLPVRMTVIRLNGGALLLHSPTRFVPGLRAELEQVGRIEHLIAPNSAHWTFVKQWQSDLPDAVTWAAPGLRHRKQVKDKEVRIDRDLEDSAPDIWADEIEHVLVRGAGGFAEVALFVRRSRTLVLTDLIQNLEPAKLPPLVRPLARIAGNTAPNGRAPIYLRAIVRLKGARAREAGTRLLALRPERVIFTHGRWFEEDATARLRKSLSWLV